MDIYAESAESQLLIKIQIWNNCMFGKFLNIFCLIELSCLYFAIHFLNVTQNYVKQASQNIYVQQLRQNSKSASTKRGKYCGNVARIKP